MRHDSPDGTAQIFLVVDDHDTVLEGTLAGLKRQYPDAALLTAQSLNGAIAQARRQEVDLVLLDLSIPETDGEEAQIETGLALLRLLMRDFPELNITVQSSYIKALVRVVHNLENHPGGFTVADKKVSVDEMLKRVEWSLNKVTYTKDIEGLRTGVEMRPQWFEVLNLAFKEGLQDQEIAKRMAIAERTVRMYWSKIYDVLGVYPDDWRKNGKNTRIQTAIKAREAGLVD
ncbi:MAG: response regulator [Elainellaceae cyanobacterium]